MEKLYKKNALIIAFCCFAVNLLRAQLPIDCNKFYLHDPPYIETYNPATSSYVTNSIACPASSQGLAVSNNINSGSPAVTFYTTVSNQYYYYNGSTWVNTGHNCTSSTAVNLCGAGPYIYNLDGLSSTVYRYNGTGNDVFVMSLSNWGGPFDLIGDDNGNFYVLYTNSGYQKLAKYSPTGALLCTYSLIGMPNSSAGAGYAIVNGKLYESSGAGNYVGTISGTTITFSPMAGSLPATVGDFASCPFPQITSGITASSNLSCSNLSAVLTATSAVTGPTYNWSGPGIVSGGNTSSATINQPGTYTVVVTGSGGVCPGSSTSTISITQTGTPPAATASSSGTVTCSSSAVNLSSSPAGMNYTWTAPGGSSITSGVNSQNAVGSGAGTYTVTIKDPVGGCTTTTVVTVNVNNSPPSAGASSGGLLTCSTTNVTLTGSPSSGVSYSWTGPGIVSGGSSANPVVNQPGTYNLTVTNTSNGCTGTATVAVSQNNTPPAASAGASGTLTCSSPNLALSGGPSTGVSYSWSGPGIVSGGSTAAPTVNQPGTYTLTVTSTSNGCTGSAAVSVAQNTTPPSATASAAGGGVLNCNATSINLNGTPATGVTYAWSGPGIVSGGTTASPVINQPGTYTLLVTSTANGCSNSASPATVSVTQNTIAINASASTNSVITCVSSAVNLSASPAGYTYTWTAAGGSSVTSGVNSQNAAGSGGGTYTVVIKDVATGCSSSAVVSIPQNTTAPTGVTASASGSITCSTSTVMLTGTPASGVTYAWTGPGIISGATTANPVVNQGGTYSLTVTNASNGCSNPVPATVNVAQNGSTPAANASVSGSLTCSATTLTLTGNTLSGASYSWTGPGIVSGGSTTSPVVNQPGTYIYNVTNTLTGCSNSATVTVLQNTIAPVASISSAGNNTLTCATPVITLTASPSGGVSYSWSGPGITSGANTANPTVNQPGNYSLTVVDPANGCSNLTPAVVAISQNTASPAVSVAATGNNGTITCAVSTVTLNASPSGGVTYSWSGPGIVSGGSTSSPVVNQPGSYSVVVTNTANGCSNVLGSSGSVMVVPIDTTKPSAQINVASTGSITCTNSVVVIDGSSSSSGSSITYTWTTSTGTVSANGNTNMPSVTGPGTYTLTVMNTANGCSQTNTVSVASNVSIPAGVDAGANALLPCYSGSLSLPGTSASGNVTYAWSGPGGYTMPAQTASNVTLPGQYTLTVTDTVTGCKATDTVNVASQNVQAGFSADPTEGVSPLLVNFTNASTGAVTYSWNFDDGNGSVLANPSNTFANTGTYTVVLVAFNSTGCSDTATGVIVVHPNFTMTIPNVFTPNNDGKNDGFYINCTGVKELTCDIYNRWGQKLFTLTGPNQSWDGLEANGNKAPEGTYMFILKVTPFDGDPVEKQGTLSLFR